MQVLDCELLRIRVAECSAMSGWKVDELTKSSKVNLNWLHSYFQSYIQVEVSTLVGLFWLCLSILGCSESVRKTQDCMSTYLQQPSSKWRWMPCHRHLLRWVRVARPWSSRKGWTELASITAALIAAALLGIWFSATRWIAVGTFAMLCALHPWLVVLVIVGVAWAFCFFRIRNHRR